MDAVCLTMGEQISARMPLGLDGLVLLKTAESLYWRTETGEILLLHDPRYGCVPFGIGVLNADLLLGRKDIPAGAKVAFRRGILAAGQAELSFDCSRVRISEHAAVEQPRPPTRRDTGFLKYCTAVYGSKSGLAALLDYEDQICGGRKTAPYKCDPDLFVKRAIPALTVLIAAMREADRAQMEGAVAGLSGLGPGLTPSGDDVLLGMTAAYGAARRAGIRTPPGAEFLPELILERYPPERAGISGAYLRAAARGECFSLVDEVLASLLGHSSRCGLKRQLRQLLSVGSSSGTDILVGISLAMDTIADSAGD